MDANADIEWVPKGWHSNEPEITEADMDQYDHEMEEWYATPEGQQFLAEEGEREAERKRRVANPDRLSKRVDPKDMPLLFAQAVQRIYDRTSSPCRMKEAGEDAGMDSDEYCVACAFAIVQGLIVHPTHPDDPDLEAPYYFMPGVG
jgi:hypothetical protein